MAMVPVQSILWRWCNRATYDTLHGNSRGQYHIAFSDTPQIHKFFEGVPRSATELGGYTMKVPVAPFDGVPSVAAQDLTIRFMGPESSRGDWNIVGQRPATAYPLWRPGRGVPDVYDDSWKEYVLLIRDRAGAFHARWISTESFSRLPLWARQSLETKKHGARSYS